LHFSYRLRISRGADDSCLSTRRCSSMRHMLHWAYTIYGMSSLVALCGITLSMSRAETRRLDWLVMRHFALAHEVTAIGH
jgi:hypothetical protein